MSLGMHRCLTPSNSVSLRFGVRLGAAGASSDLIVYGGQELPHEASFAVP